MERMVWEEYAEAEKYDTTFDKSFKIPYECEETDSKMNRKQRYYKIILMLCYRQYGQKERLYIMTLRDIYCYTPNTQKFIIFSESDRNHDLWERVPIFKGYLENCNAELMDEIVDHFLVGANRTIIVVLCI